MALQSSGPQEHRLGLTTTLIAYLMWGIFPLYWKLLTTVPSAEIICHRITWSALIPFPLLLSTCNFSEFLTKIRPKDILLRCATTSILLGVNWLFYVWMINSDYICATSQGYFINPLVALLLGVFSHDGKLNRVQWMALGIVFVSVSYLAVTLGKLPWAGVFLALTFGFDSLLRKTAKSPSLEGLFLEMALLSVPSSFILFLYSSYDNSHFATSGLTTALFLIGTGIITTIPLLFFIFGAQRISMITMGLLQYIAFNLAVSHWTHRLPRTFSTGEMHRFFNNMDWSFPLQRKS